MLLVTFVYMWDKAGSASSWLVVSRFVSIANNVCIHSFFKAAHSSNEITGYESAFEYMSEHVGADSSHHP